MLHSASDVSSQLTLSLVFIGLLLGACDLAGNEDDSPPPQRIEQTFTFGEDPEGWTSIFADYPTDADTTSEGMALTFGRRPLPDEVPTGHGLFLSGRNTSDDLFMGLRRRLADVAPNTTYALTVDVTLASASPSGCAGVGGAPGESVWVKAGGSAIKPERTVDENGWYRLTTSKGNQSQGGSGARVLGTVANGVKDCRDTPFRLIERTMEDPLSATADGDGALWLLVGTDSGFEATTRLYYDSIRVALDPK